MKKEIRKGNGGTPDSIPRGVPKNTAEFDRINELTGAGLPRTDDLSVLSSGYRIKDFNVPNRLVCQPMEGCDGCPDGSPGELTIRRAHRLASSGAGIIWFEATACLPEARANPRQLMLTQENISSFARLADEMREISVRENGFAPLIMLQLTHSGRYSRPQGVPAPIRAYSWPEAERGSETLPALITDDGLDEVREALLRSSALTEKAGFDGADIKCCHRYLNSELLSAYTRENSRYGGDFEGRTRLIRETLAGAVANASRGFIVGTRINIYDGIAYPYGFGCRTDGTLEPDMSEPVKLIRILYGAGASLIDITAGNPYFNPHVNRPFAAGPYTPEEHPACGVARMLELTAEVKRSLPEDLPVISSGLSWLGAASPGVAAAYIEKGGFDFAGFGRLTLACPGFAKKILRGEGLRPSDLCAACSGCTSLMRLPGGTPGCVIKDRLYTDIYKIMRSAEAK